MKRNFFPKNKKPTTPKPSSSALDGDLIAVQFSGQEGTNLVLARFGKNPQQYPASEYHALPTGEEFTCVLCRRKTYDHQSMGYHFMAHAERIIIQAMQVDPKTRAFELPESVRLDFEGQENATLQPTSVTQ